MSTCELSSTLEYLLTYWFFKIWSPVIESINVSFIHRFLTDLFHLPQSWWKSTLSLKYCWPYWTATMVPWITLFRFWLRHWSIQLHASRFCLNYRVKYLTHMTCHQRDNYLVLCWMQFWRANYQRYVLGFKITRNLFENFRLVVPRSSDLVCGSTKLLVFAFSSIHRSRSEFKDVCGNGRWTLP